MKIKYLFLINFVCAVFSLPAQAQLSGMKGKSSALTVMAQFQPLRSNSYFHTYTSPAANFNMNPSLQVNYEKAWSRQESMVVQARYFSSQGNPSYEKFIEHPITKQYEDCQRFDNYRIVQVGVAYATYRARNWALAPIGKSMQWGFNLNAMFYNLEEKFENISRSAKGTYLFPSISWQFNNRLPIATHLSLNMGVGLEVPIGLYKFQKKESDSFKLTILTNFILSRLLSVGLSYNL